MTKNERIARLEIRIEALQEQVNQLLLADVLEEPPGTKHFESKGPAPYNKPSFCED